MAEAKRRQPGGEQRAVRSRDSAVYPEPVARLIESFAKLPGIGRRSAERLAMHVLTAPSEEAAAFARALSDVKTSVRHCDVCFNLCRERLCSICEDTRRDRSTVLVVEQPKELIALETAGAYRGLYHVLMGRIDPLEGIGPDAITIDALAARLEDPSKNTGGEPVRELILGTNPTLEGDGTALYMAEVLKGVCEQRGVAMTRLARGVPMGGQIETTGRAVLADAIAGRTAMARDS